MTRPLFLLAIFFSYFVHAQQKRDAITYSLFFVGDAGESYIAASPLGKVLHESVRRAGPNATVLFLGDNIYPKGMPGESEKGRITAEKIIQSQVDWIKDLNADGIFIPGNHDWRRGKKQGWDQLINEQRWIDSLKNDHIKILPRDGCPGPVEISVSDEVTLVIIDTQWFLHPWDKPGESSVCAAKTSAEVLLQLQDIFQRNATKRVLVAAHHPLITYGEHGGELSIKEHIFPLTSFKRDLYIPLPVVGSFYVFYRKWFGDIQDTSNPIYQKMIRGFGGLLKEHPGNVYVAGHEHSLQAIVKDSTYFIVSGAGSKTTHVKKKKYSRFAAKSTGFVKADVFKNGSMRLEYFRVDRQYPDGKLMFSDSLQPRPRFNAIPH